MYIFVFVAKIDLSLGEPSFESDSESERRQESFLMGREAVDSDLHGEVRLS